MVKLLLLLAASVTVAVVAEYPLGRAYLPPTNTEFARARSSLSGRYNAPASRNGAPSSFGGFNGGLSNRYSTPSLVSRRFNNLPTQYGTPSATSSRFGANSNQYPTTSRRFNALPAEYNSPFNRFNVPSSQYDISATSNRFTGPSIQYGVPSIISNRFNYRVPSTFSRSLGSPLTRYDIPFEGYRALDQEDPLAEPANYEFNYEVQDAESGAEFGHEETRQDESAQGSYRVLLPDGRLQIVEYQADEEGYKPEIRYEETAYSRNSQGPYPASRAGQGPY